MRTNIKAVNVSLAPEVREYLDRRLTALDKFIDPTDDANICYVEIGRTTSHHKTGDIFRAEITCHIGGKSLRAEAEKEDLYSAIDEVKDEMALELRRDKTKRLSLVKRGGLVVKNLLKGISSVPQRAARSFRRENFRKLGRYFRRPSRSGKK
jgi:putative sigma-54 modulation protein